MPKTSVAGPNDRLVGRDLNKERGTPDLGFKGGNGKEKKSKTKALPPGYNPLKYEANPTQSYKATPSNLAKLAGTLLSEMALPGAGALLSPAINEVAGDPLGLGFEKPTGIVPGAVKADDTLKLMAPAERKPVQPEGAKKKKPQRPGFQLIEGAGGTLLGS